MIVEYTFRLSVQYKRIGTASCINLFFFVCVVRMYRAYKVNRHARFSKDSLQTKLQSQFSEMV